MKKNKDDKEDVTIEEDSIIKSEIDVILVNIRLISKIDVGDKIFTRNKYLDIDNSIVQSFSRWYNEINRHDNMENIIKIYKRAFELYDNLKKNKNTIILSRLVNDLKMSITGLLNYKQTYNTDKLFQSEIDVLIDNIRNKIDEN